MPKSHEPYAIPMRTRGFRSRFPMRGASHAASLARASPGAATGTIMQDIIWIAIMLGLLAATLAYVRLCGTM